MLTGDTVSASDAENWGMLTRVVEDADFETALGYVVTELAGRSQLSVQAHKHLIRLASDTMAVTAGFGQDEISEALFREVLEGPDACIGQQAFLAKEQPRFEWSGEHFWSRHQQKAISPKAARQWPRLWRRQRGFSPA